MSTRFTGSARSGISPLTLVLFIFLSFVAGIIAFVMYTKQVKTQLAVDDIASRKEQIDKQTLKISDERLKLSGYLAMEGKRAEDVRAYLEALDLKGLPVDKDAAGTADPKLRNFRTISADLSLWIMRLNMVAADLRSEITNATAQAAKETAARDATRDAYTRRVQELKAQLGTLTDFLRDETAKKEALVKQYGDEKQGFTDKYNNARDDHEAKKSALLRDAEKATRRNAVVRRDLKVLRPEPSLHPPAGHVVLSDWRTNKVEVDLSEREHVFPGLVLEVYYFNADGQRALKGKLEIMTVGTASSLCSVVESDVKNPIIAGDPVQTRFIPVRPGQKFVIAGFISPDAPYDREKLKAIIQLNGGVIQDSVGLGTDCLILGETAARGLADLDKKAAETAPDEARRGLEQSEVARELSVDIVSYEDFIQGLLH